MVLTQGKRQHSEFYSSPSPESKTVKDISVGNSGKATLAYSDKKTLIQTEGNTSLSSGTLDTNTNLIIAQFTDRSGNKNYLVWTADAVGSNVAQTILEKIQASDGFNDSSAKISDIKFRSGANPGTIPLAGGGSNTITYDSSSGAISFAKGDGETGTFHLVTPLSETESHSTGKRWIM